MDFEDYHTQVLVSLAKRCKPNSPKPSRAWVRVEPIYGLPEFGNALSALIRKGLLIRDGYRVKPSQRGYVLYGQWKAYRLELKRRPILFDQVIWEPRVADLKLAA